MLKCSLLGSTAQILWDMSTDSEDSYERMVELLKQRYGTSGQAEAYRAQLRGKKQGKGESLNVLMTEVKRLMCLAYPGPTSEMGQIVARDAFIDSLTDRQIAIKIREREPMTLDAAYQIAVRIEAYNQVTIGGNIEEKNKNPKIRGIELDYGQMVEELLNTQKLMKRQLDEQSEKIKEMSSTGKDESRQVGRGRSSAGSRGVKPKIICHKCNQEGHIRPYCPLWEEEKKERENKDTNGDKTSVLKDHKVSRVGEALYVDLLLGTEQQECLIDSGAEVTVIPLRLVDRQQMQSTSKLLRAANDTNIEMTGVTTIKVTIGESEILTEFLVSEQVNEIIIGLDWLVNNDCVINFSDPHMMMRGYKIPLRRSKFREE